METQIKGDKQALGIIKRNKKRFEAQEMLVQLNVLAHNLVIWSRRLLAPSPCRIQGFGVLRIVRDVFQVAGWVIFQGKDCLCRIFINKADPLADSLWDGLRA